MGPQPPARHCTYPACGQHTRCTHWGSRWTHCLRRSSSLGVGVGVWPAFAPHPRLTPLKAVGQRWPLSAEGMGTVALGRRMARTGVAPWYKADREGADRGCKEGRTGAGPSVQRGWGGPWVQRDGQGSPWGAERCGRRDPWVQRDGLGVVLGCRGVGQGHTVGCRGMSRGGNLDANGWAGGTLRCRGMG